MSIFGSEPIPGQVNLEGGTLTPEAQLRLRINEPGIFHSPQDRVIALNFLGQLEERLDGGLIDRQRYERAITALDDLVPKKNERGNRLIADITITPLMEQTIRSRIDSEEVDIMSRRGSWGKLPEEVKKQIAVNSGLLIEMTTNCTVRCSFCALANKGPIQQKATFISVLEVLKYFRDHQQSPPGWYKSDGLYWGTDPFDAKWATNYGDLDYHDLAQAYWRLMGGVQRFLDTSTAIPIGEELRVLRFADDFIKKKRAGEIISYNYFRISQTNANAERLSKIKQVLEALHDNPISEDLIDISNNRNDNIAMRGKAWEKEVHTLSLWDIIGLNCRDDVIIGVRSVDGIIMEGASNEKPKGEDRFPIIEEIDGIRTNYFIPRHQEKPDLKKAEIREIYPDPIIIKVMVGDKGTRVQEIKVTDDPHRAFLRMVGVLYNFVAKRGHKLESVTAQDKLSFRTLLSNEAQLVQSYLDSGAENKAMRMFMEFFIKQGFI